MKSEVSFRDSCRLDRSRSKPDPELIGLAGPQNVGKHGVHGPSGKTKKKLCVYNGRSGGSECRLLELGGPSLGRAFGSDLADLVDHKDRLGLPTRNSKVRLTPLTTTFSKVGVRIPLI